MESLSVQTRNGFGRNGEHIPRWRGRVLATLTLVVATLSPTALAPSPASGAAQTTIVVNSTLDLANSSNFDNDTCGYTSGVIFTDPGDGVCTFRRAIVEAGARPDADRPIEIVFEIPKDDPNYLEEFEAWEVQIDESWELQLDRANVFDDGGQVTIDGSTQPIGRDDGPRIMVNTNRDNSALGGRSLEIYTSGNTITNIGFHGGGEIILYEGRNVIENIWMGLDNSGLEMQLASDASTQAQRSLARGGITLPNEDSDGNKITNNIIIGAIGRAIRIIGGGDDNIISGNWIGMNAQGEVGGGSTLDCTRELDYDPGRWYGGEGILILGDANTIEANVLAALHVPQAEAVTPPIAFEIDGVGNSVRDNVVGDPAGGGPQGVCGQGALLAGHDSSIIDNEFIFSRNGFDPNDVGSQLDAAILTQSFSSAVPNPTLTVHSNEITGLDQTEANFYAYRFAAGVPTAMRQFNPGKILDIDGVTVTGTNGDDSITGVSGFCPNCTVFLYLDDLDDRVEALDLMTTTVADGNGDWTAILPRELNDGESLRTQSMANAANVMHTFGAGTTSRLSDDVATDLSRFTLLPAPCVAYRSIGAFAGLDGPIEGGETRTVAVAGFLPSPQNPSSSNCIPEDATAAMVTIQAISPSQAGNLRLSEAGVVPSGGVVNFVDNDLDNANTVSVPLSSDGEVDITGNGGSFGVGDDLAHVQLMVLGYYSPQGSLQFSPLTPCAAADSRMNQDASGSFLGPFGQTSSYPLVDVVGSIPAGQGGGNTDCGVPPWAEGVLVNVVAINPAGAAGALEVGASATDPNRESTPFAPIGMNNAAATAVPLNGGETIEVDITGSVGLSTHVRVVVLGYFEDPATSQGHSDGADYTPVNPCAAFDTRASQGGSGLLQTAGSTTTYQIADGGHGIGGGPGCGVPDGASGVLINLVAITPVGEGNLQAFATGSSPTGGVLNFAALSPAMNNANAVPIPLSASGSIDVFVNGGPVPVGTPLTHVRGVVLGYFD